MDTGKIKALATGARVQLMDGVRASLERVLAPDSPESINERNRVNDLRNEAKDKEALVERVAYTWFNRLCALRLMDSRGYTPVPVVTPRSGETMPAILADARRGIFCADFPLRSDDKQRVASLVSGGTDSVNPLGEAYVILLLSACDYYAKPIPALFGSDPRSMNAMRLLAPTSLLSENSILQRIVEGMDDENCKEVEVMGWLYQYYIAELKDEVFEAFRNNKKAGPDDIKPATQLFTPNWIVRYMVENSLGKLWMRNYPESELIEKMDYYIDADSDSERYQQIESPEEITFLDPAMGSGHILVYAFDLLFEMYREEGYRPSEIPRLILQKNLSGYEIDDRAAEIAAFALAMKARERDESFIEQAVQPDLYVFHPVNLEDISVTDLDFIAGHRTLLEALAHIDQLGSLYNPEPSDVVLLENAISNVVVKDDLFAGHTLDRLKAASLIVNKLSRRFCIVVANPPYMGSGNMNTWLATWLSNYYPNEKSDLCTCFIKRIAEYTKSDGYCGIVTSHTWMYLPTFENMRKDFLNNETLTSLVHLSPHGFINPAAQVCIYCYTNSPVKGKGQLCNCIRLIDYDRPQLQGPKTLEAIHNHGCGWFYSCDPSNFASIPGTPISYWASDGVYHAFADGTPLRDVSQPRQGLVTGNNERFMRLWWEPSFKRIGFGLRNREAAAASGSKWFPCTKGGGYRKWFGNNWYLVNWERDGEAIRTFERNGRIASRPQNVEWYFQEGMTWGAVASSSLSMRYCPWGFVPEHAGSMAYFEGGRDKGIYCLALANSSVASLLLQVLSQTLRFNESTIGQLPVIYANEDRVISLANDCISIAKTFFDEDELSWDYRMHPLLSYSMPLRSSVEALRHDIEDRTARLEEFEAELDRIFIDAYSLDDELSTNHLDQTVFSYTYSEKQQVVSLVSYAVGCMFGRYSLDQDSLILANQDSTLEDYFSKIPTPTFKPDEDGILPITEEEWFEDDIVTEFWRWLKAAFGEEHFDENLAYIEETLGCKLREYFIKGRRSAFYDDHCKTYSVTGSGKRPIYWMFSSPKSSFNCLVYTHRYDDRTVSKILTDYVRELRRKLEAQARGLEVSDVARDRTRAAKYHDMIEELNDWERDVLYPMAQRHIKIDLDDGVRHNYKLFPGALRKVTGLS